MPLKKLPSKKPAPRRRRLRLVLIAGLTVVSLLLFLIFPGTVAWLMTRGGTRPMDRRLTDTPATYGAPYEEVTFQSTDGTPLSGWYLPGSRGVGVVLCHGRFRSRREVLRQAVALWRHGYSALLFDFRHHGESGGRISTFGYDERKDVIGAVRYLRERRGPSQRIAALGVSMGAAAVLLAAAEEPAIEAVITDSVFRSFRDTVSHHIRMFLHLPAFPFTDEILLFMRGLAGIDSRAFDMEAAVKKIDRRPILLIVGAADRRMPPAISQDLYALSHSPSKALWIVPNATHGHAYLTDPRRYETVTVDFLDAALTGQSKASE